MKLLRQNTGRKAIALTAVVALMSFGGLTLGAEPQGNGRGRGRDQQPYGALNGTYELDRAQGDTPERAAENATRTLPVAQRDQAYRAILARLQAPAQLSIERRGRSITMTSNMGRTTTFQADGQTRAESVRNENGVSRRMSTRATLIGERLTISSQGNRATDFVVTFEPLQGGQRMLVTRQIYNANYGNRPIISRTYYTRVSTDPRWDLYSGGAGTYDPRYDNRGTGRTNSAFAIPDGTRITATLDSPIDTRTARAGDRFSMTVQGPSEYRDARIDGVIRSANVSANDKPADLRIEFDTIRLRSGQTSSINATIDSVRTPGGDVLRVDPEGRTDTDIDKSKTIETGAIGAAIGGVIGVLAGGTKGAVIGAVLGGAAGAGGSILANRNDRYLDLPVGTELTLITNAYGAGR